MSSENPNESHPTMLERPTYLPEAAEAANELNALYRILGDQVSKDPRCIYWFRRLIEADPASAVDAHVSMAVKMAVLPPPLACGLDGRPLFTFQQVAKALGVEVGGLCRKVVELPNGDAGSSVN
ncbi:hypothetical protein D9M68_891270 [compost metagenome]